MSSSGDLLRDGTPIAQNHQLLLNVMHWLSRAEGMGE